MVLLQVCHLLGVLAIRYFLHHPEPIGHGLAVLLLNGWEVVRPLSAARRHEGRLVLLDRVKECNAPRLVSGKEFGLFLDQTVNGSDNFPQ